ncbi:MAG: MATE family efflux transporter [Gammaproteobacteria bacterium]|nr:MATE family efflux transporter [Gammaproteobacteria bacterium]
MNNPHDLTQGSIARHLVRLTIPMFLGISSMIVASMIEMIYIGWIGTLELAAVSFTMPLVMAISSVSMGLGVGATSIMSRILGGGERDRCILIGTHTLLLVVLAIAVVAVVGYVYAPETFAALGAGDELLPLTVEYIRIWYLGLIFFTIPMVGGSMLRALGDAKTPGILMVAGAVIQVIIAPMLIFGVGSWDGLGFLGSAWSFLISRLVIFVVTMAVFGRVGLLRRPGSLSGIFASWREVMRIGVPSMAASLVGPASMGILIGILARHGHVIVAAFGVAVRIEMLAIMILMSLSSSVSPFAGQNWGARQYGRIRKSLTLSYRFSILWGIFIFGLLAIFGQVIVGFINDDPRVVEVTYEYLLIVPLTYGLMGVGSMAASCFVALGRPMPSLVISVTRMIVVTVPLALIFDFYWGPTGVFVATAIANIGTGSLGFFWIRSAVPTSDPEPATADRGRPAMGARQ